MYIWFDMFLLYCSTYFVTFRRAQKDKDLIIYTNTVQHMQGQVM